MHPIYWLFITWLIGTFGFYGIYSWLKGKHDKRYKTFGQQHGGKGNKIHKTLGDIIMRREF